MAETCSSSSPLGLRSYSNVSNYCNVTAQEQFPAAYSCGDDERLQQLEREKAQIISHPYYPRLALAYIECVKFGAPADVLCNLENLSAKFRNQLGSEVKPSDNTSRMGLDSELDKFMESYLWLLQRYHAELSTPYQNALGFCKSVETQLQGLLYDQYNIDNNNITPDDRSSTVHNDIKFDGSTKENGDAFTHELSYDSMDRIMEDKEMKDKLFQKHRGKIQSLRKQFLNKVKKGKLPKHSRQTLIDWWTQHYKWPYPTEAEKTRLVQETGLDAKQINNWFINQRKRHWKPSEEINELSPS